MAPLPCGTSASRKTVGLVVCLVAVVLWSRCSELPTASCTGVLWILTGPHPCGTSTQAGWWRYQSASSYVRGYVSGVVVHVVVPERVVLWCNAVWFPQHLKNSNAILISTLHYLWKYHVKLPKSTGKIEPYWPKIGRKGKDERRTSLPPLSFDGAAFIRLVWVVLLFPSPLAFSPRPWVVVLPPLPFRWWCPLRPPLDPAVVGLWVVLGTSTAVEEQSIVKSKPECLCFRWFSCC